MSKRSLYFSVKNVWTINFPALLLIGLKLFTLVPWPWVWVLAPLWLPALLKLVLSVVAKMLVGVIVTIERFRE